jgi:Nucleotidyl transferase AbiEii toxin, Type IV TA system
MFPLEAFQNTLSKIVAIFERHSIHFHLTGGITSIAYGEPRMTQDVDIVIDNHAVSSQLEPFLESLETSDFMNEPSVIRQAIVSKGMFQLLDRVESLKLDIYAREMIPGELDRSEYIEVFEGMTLPIASRSDAAMSKLVWISKGSHKSRRDLRHIYRNANNAERDLIRALAKQFQLGSLLDEVLNEPDELLD